MREMNKRTLVWIAAITGGLACLLLAPALAGAQDAVTYYRQSCMSCHTIGGGRLVGPDLKDVAKRKDRPWLLNFIQNPKAVLDSGDPYALKLKQEAGGAVMVPIAGMTPQMAEDLLALIEAESKLPKSQFTGLQITDEPFSPADIARGRDLFTGHVRLAHGGPSCLSCHTTGAIEGLSGGRLGPDLTRVYERLKGRKGLASWLQAPATPTMQSVYGGRALTNEEILPLVAWLEAEARRGGEDDGTSRLTFLLLGLGGAAAGLAVFDGAWRRRFRAVRRPLVKGQQR